MGNTPKQVRRFDQHDLSTWMTTPFSETPEGFLTGRAIVTSCGVFSYRRADGSMEAELRLPEEVFNRESLDSMKLKPITNDHPQDLVTPETARAVQVGTLGGEPTSWVDSYAIQYPKEQGRGGSGSDGVHVATDLMITDAQTIADIKAGKRALSMGYTCDMEETSGVWAGIAYTAIQRNIRYNHCAVVDVARAGDAACIHLDSLAAVFSNRSPRSRRKPDGNEEDQFGRRRVRRGRKTRPCIRRTEKAGGRGGGSPGEGKGCPGGQPQVFIGYGS